jgi:hypothetical protein
MILFSLGETVLLFEVTLELHASSRDAIHIAFQSRSSSQVDG